MAAIVLIYSKMCISKKYVTYLIEAKQIAESINYSLPIWNQFLKIQTPPHKITNRIDWCISPEGILLWINLRAIPMMKEDG